MTMRHFLCGCDSEDPNVRNYHPKIEWVNGKQVLQFKHYDKAGNEICPIHGKPLKGSAFPVKRGPQGNDIPDHHKDYLRRYGPTPRRELTSTVVDRRDNSDPEEVGRLLLEERRISRESSIPVGNGEPPIGPARWGSD